MLRSLGIVRGGGRAASWRLFAFALTMLMVLAPSVLKAQTTIPPEISSHDVEPTFKLQSERNLVMVGVVVRTGKGKPVDNLRQEDFQLFDRGKKQTIVLFSVEKATPKTIESTAPGSAEPITPAESGAAGGKPSSPLAASRRFVAMYFDDVNTEFADWVRTHEAAERFLQAPFPPGAQVGVFTASGQKPLDFTEDLAKVRQAVADLRRHPLVERDERCDLLPYEGYRIVELDDPNALQLAIEEIWHCWGEPPEPPSPGEVRQEAQRTLSQGEMQSQVALRGIESLVRLMSTLPGQRSIVIVSGGFMSEKDRAALSQISDRALRANIIINALDTRGLFGGASADASLKGGSLNYLTKKDSMMRANALWVGDGIRTLAQDTGGVFFENNNDLETGFRQLAAIPDTSYLLAFSPEDLKHDGAFHPLKITLVSAKGLTLQARKGYYAPQKAEDLAVQEKEDLQDAVFSTNEIQGLPIEVSARYFMIGKTDAEIDVVTHVDLHPLHFRKEADRNLDNLTIVTAAFDRDGHYVSGQQKILEMRLRGVSLEKILRTGIKVETELHVRPGTYLVRTVVRDSESGQISILNRTVDVPY